MADDPPPPTEADYPDDAGPRPFGRNGTTSVRSAAIRVPPHDLAAEASFLGALLLSADGAATDAWTLAPRLAASDFFKPAHGHIYDAIAGLRDTGQPADSVTVTARLADTHLLDAAGGVEAVVGLAANPVGVISGASAYAAIIGRRAYQRRLIGFAASLTDAAYLTDEVDIVGMVARVQPPATSAQASIVADMQAILNGDNQVTIPSLAPRDDHATCLLYAPGINWLDGEPGRGKSLLAMWWAYRELAAGRRVVYIQFEGEGNAAGFGARLKQMGLSDASGLSYVHRSGSWTPTDLAELRSLFALEPSLVVVDSVASAMQAEGLDPESNADVERWKATIPSWASGAGAAFLAVDHLTKNPDTRGRYSIGAQRKLGIADVSLRLSMHAEPGLGRTGHGRLEVMKDREGALGEYQNGRTVAEVTIASEHRGDTYDLRVTLAPPADANSPGAHNGPSWYMERVSRELEAHGPLGKVELRTRIGRHKPMVDLALERLLDDGAVEIVDIKGRGKPYRSVYPWSPEAATVVAPSFYERAEADTDEAF